MAILRWAHSVILSSTHHVGVQVDSTCCQGGAPRAGQHPLLFKYKLPDPQVQPDAPSWIPSPTQPKPYKLELPTLEEIKAVGDLLVLEHPFPPDAAGLKADVDELEELALLKDEASAVAKSAGPDDRRRRAPLSRFLQLCPQPLGAVFDTKRLPDTLVVETGRELSRWFENETPGLAHAHALNLLFAEAPLGKFSPPRQAQIWTALNLAIYAGLLAAWHYKWVEPTTRFKPRPIEVDPVHVNVLYDNKLKGDGTMQDGELRDGPFPGTPRYPSYPSGHSTVGGAASAVLSHFFEEEKTEFDNLADNAVLARLWAGVHYRPDHEFGMALGRAVTGLILKQLPPKP